MSKVSIDTNGKLLIEDARILYRNFGGRETVDKQLEYLLNMDTEVESFTTFKFCMYVFVRALWVFKRDDISYRCKNFILHLDDELRVHDKDNQCNGHPWEIIFKYLALLALKLGELNQAKNYIERSKLDKEKKGRTIELIIHNGLIEYAEHEGDKELLLKERKFFEKQGIYPNDIAVFMYH